MILFWTKKFNQNEDFCQEIQNENLKNELNLTEAANKNKTGCLLELNWSAAHSEVQRGIRTGTLTHSLGQINHSLPLIAGKNIDVQA